jgi:hypothetical protein
MFIDIERDISTFVQYSYPLPILRSGILKLILSIYENRWIV